MLDYQFIVRDTFAVADVVQVLVRSYQGGFHIENSASIGTTVFCPIFELVIIERGILSTTTIAPGHLPRCFQALHWTLLQEHFYEHSGQNDRTTSKRLAECAMGLWVPSLGRGLGTAILTD